jgi:hypothetical protein
MLQPRISKKSLQRAMAVHGQAQARDVPLDDRYWGSCWPLWGSPGPMGLA